jgi:hypothetical protein
VAQVDLWLEVVESLAPLLEDLGQGGDGVEHGSVLLVLDNLIYMDLGT